MCWSHGAARLEGGRGQGRRPARSSPTISTTAEALANIPSHRALALLRGRNEEILSLDLVLGRRSRKAEWHRCSARANGAIAARFGIVDRRTGPADAWLQETVRWTWRVKLRLHIETELMTRLREQAETRRSRCSADNLKDLLLAAPAGGRATMGLDPGPAHRREGRGASTPPARCWTPRPSIRTSRSDDWDESLAHPGRAGVEAQRRADRDRQRHRLARDRQAGGRADQAASAS